MLTVGINHPTDGAVTESTVFGPFFVEGTPHVDLGGDVGRGAPGEPAWVEGTVTDPTGRPLPGARIEVWEADEAGFYDVQYGDGASQGRAHLYAEDAGRYRFWCVKPAVPDPR